MVVVAVKMRRTEQKNISDVGMIKFLIRIDII